MMLWAVGQQGIKPMRNPFEVFIPLWQRARMHQDFTNIVQVAVEREPIEEFMSQFFTGCSQAGEQCRVWASVEPEDDPARSLGLGEPGQNRLQLL